MRAAVFVVLTFLAVPSALASHGNGEEVIVPGQDIYVPLPDPGTPVAVTCVSAFTASVWYNQTDHRYYVGPGVGANACLRVPGADVLEGDVTVLPAHEVGAPLPAPVLGFTCLGAFHSALILRGEAIAEGGDPTTWSTYGLPAGIRLRNCASTLP